MKQLNFFLASLFLASFAIAQPQFSGSLYVVPNSSVAVDGDYAIKQDRTSFNASNNLKTSMLAKGRDVSLQEWNTYYDGGAAEYHLLLHDLGNGSFRSIRYTSNLAADPDIVDATDATLVRMWVLEELAIAIAQVQGVSSSSGSLNVTTWTWTIVRNGVNYTGSDTKKVDACCKAFRALIDAL